MARLKDSTKTRVKPVFDTLLRQDTTGIQWVSRLVGLLPIRPGIVAPVVPLTPLVQWCWGKEEKRLAPPPDLLRWLVQNLSPPLNGQWGKKPETREKRKRLVARDNKTIDQALRLLDQRPISTKCWYVFEGETCPDVYLESENLIVIIEGKRTESGPTIHTTWMPTRHQMLRHIDCAWECRKGRDVLGFFIVEGGGRFDMQAAVTATVQKDNLEASLPHRNAAEREAISRCFLGATTWQRVCQEFNIAWADLPDSTSIN